MALLVGVLSNGLIPGQGTDLGCGSIPDWAGKKGNRSMFVSHGDVSISSSFSFPLSLKSINISLGEYENKHIGFVNAHHS